MSKEILLKENSFYISYDERIRKILTINCNKVTYQKYDRFWQPINKVITTTKSKFEEWAEKEYIKPSQDEKRSDHITNYFKSGYTFLGTTNSGVNVAYWKDERNNTVKYWIIYYSNNIVINTTPVELPEDVLKMLCDTVKI